MQFGRRYTASYLFLLVAAYQPSTYALTDYVATGSFFGDSLEVIQYDFDTAEETFVDAFLDSQPFPISSSTFTLYFSVDESVDGNVPVFSPAAFFSGAVSNVSLEVNGVNVFSSPSEVATVSQFPGDFSGTLPAGWSWSLFPDSSDLSLPNLSVFDVDTFAPLGNATPQGFFFGLTDSARQIYGGGSFLDLISLNYPDFDGTSFQLFWGSNFDDEPDFDEEPPEINYTVFGTVDSLTNLSAVPLPGGIWLLLSAMAGFVVANRRNPAS